MSGRVPGPGWRPWPASTSSASGAYSYVTRSPHHEITKSQNPARIPPRRKQSGRAYVRRTASRRHLDAIGGSGGERARYGSEHGVAGGRRGGARGNAGGRDGGLDSRACGAAGDPSSGEADGPARGEEGPPAGEGDGAPRVEGHREAERRRGEQEEDSREGIRARRQKGSGKKRIGEKAGGRTQEAL